MTFWLFRKNLKSVQKLRAKVDELGEIIALQKLPISRVSLAADLRRPSQSNPKTN